MKRTILLVSLGLLAFGVASVMAVLFLARIHIVGYFLEYGVKELKNDGFRVRYDSLTASGLSFSIKDLEVWKGLVSFAADEVTVRPTLGALPSMALAGTIEAKLYGGSAKFSPQIGSDKSFRLNGDVRELQLAQHPQLLGSGISDGTLTLNLDSLVASPDQTCVVRGRVAISRLEINPPPLPIPVKVPPIRDGSVQFDLESSERETLLSNATIQSSIMNADGEIKLSHDHFRHPSALIVRAKVRITAEGQPFIGPYLPLISQGTLRPEASQFRITIDARRCGSGNTAVFRMGGTPFCGKVAVE